MTELWTPRPHVLVIVTAGRFTAAAVERAEKHNHDGKPALVEMWPDIQLEQLLAERPHLIAEYNLL
jgi:hypothetical protein